LAQQPRGPVAVALVLWLLFFAANAFAVIKSPYPQKPEAPDHIIVIGDDRVGPIADTATKPK
jgi:hypothetical protein